MGIRLPWPEIRRRTEFQGQWIALEHCVFEAQTSEPTEGEVVDSDENLGELCKRVKRGEGRNLVIRFCDAAQR